MPESTQTHQIGGDHYTRMRIQPWDAMQVWMTPESFQGFLRGSVIKYLARTKNGLEDLEKAAHTLQKLIEVVRHAESQKSTTERSLLARICFLENEMQKHKAQLEHITTRERDVLKSLERSIDRLNNLEVRWALSNDDGK